LIGSGLVKGKQINVKSRVLQKAKYNMALFLMMGAYGCKASHKGSECLNVETAKNT
jgi:hypothetical protein